MTSVCAAAPFPPREHVCSAATWRDWRKCGRLPLPRRNAGHVKRGVPSMGHSVPLRKRPPTDTRMWSDGHGASK